MTIDEKIENAREQLKTCRWGERKAIRSIIRNLEREKRGEYVDRKKMLY